MLILSSSIDQSVYLDFSEMSDAELIALRRERVTVTVTDIRKGPTGQSVRLGYVAPKGLKIHRGKVYESIRRERALERKGSQS